MGLIALIEHSPTDSMRVPYGVLREQQETVRNCVATIS